jgi:hypothetical protein
MKYVNGISELVEALPHTITEPSVVTPECPYPYSWRAYDGMGTEVEVLYFIYSLVRMLKPMVCVETGTWVGYGAAYIAQALKDNGGGILITAEPDMDKFVEANRLMTRLGFTKYVVVKALTGEQVISDYSEIDFAFLDSEWDSRVRELEMLKSRLSNRGVILVHDTSTFHDSHCHLRSNIVQSALNSGLQYINLDTPRGLMLLRL